MSSLNTNLSRLASSSPNSTCVMEVDTFQREPMDNTAADVDDYVSASRTIISDISEVGVVDSSVGWIVIRDRLALWDTLLNLSLKTGLCLFRVLWSTLLFGLRIGEFIGIYECFFVLFCFRRVKY